MFVHANWKLEMYSHFCDLKIDILRDSWLQLKQWGYRDTVSRRRMLEEKEGLFKIAWD
jgi:hypothetical protein